MKKKLISIGMVIVMLLLMQPMTFANAETYKSYKEIIDSTINTYGEYEESINFDATGLIYGEFIDFDNDNTKEMLLIYKKKNDNSYDAPWANIVIYGMKENTPVKLLEEGVYGSLGQTDVGYEIMIKDINGQKHLRIDSKKTPVSYGDSENVIIFTMQNNTALVKKYYGEVLPWWDTYEFNYTKCMIDNTPVSEEKYISDLHQFYTDSQRLNLFPGKDDDVFVYCTKEKLDKFLLDAKNVAEKGITVLLDDNEVIFDQPPIIVDGRTLVPLRAIFEELGATVDWDGNTQTVTSTKGQTTISMSIGKTEMYKNGKLITLDVVPRLVGGRTLVPVRAVAEGFDCKVDWDGDNQTVIIKNHRY